MTESTIELIQELQLVARHNSPQRRAKLDLPLLTALSRQGRPGASVGEAIDAAVAEAALHPESEPLVTLFPPSSELWHSNLSGRQRQAAAQVGMSYDSFRRRRDGRPSPYDELCEALLDQLLRSHGDASTIAEAPEAHEAPLTDELVAHESVRRDVLSVDSAIGARSQIAGGTSTAVLPAPSLEGDHRTARTTATESNLVGSTGSKDVRLRNVVIAGAVLLIALVAAQQLRTGSPDEVAATTELATPIVNLGQPSALIARPSDVHIELSWMPAADGDAPDGYDIARDDVGYWSITDPNTVSFTDESVESGRTYTYAVTPWLANGSEDPADRIYGPPSDTVEVAITLMQNSLGQPVDVFAEPIAGGNRLEWRASTEGVVPDGFDIARDGAGYWSLEDPNTRFFVDEGAEPGRVYTYAVTPWLANGSDDPADRTYGPSSAVVEAAVAD